jgi:hypothetical protein
MLSVLVVQPVGEGGVFEKWKREREREDRDVFAVCFGEEIVVLCLRGVFLVWSGVWLGGERLWF